MENYDKKLEKMIEVVTRLNLWDWLRDFKPDENSGNMFGNSPEVGLIYREVVKDGHSGISFLYCLMETSYIAKIGVEEYYKVK